MLETFLPESPSPWLWIPLILMVAAFSTAVIWFTTKSAMKAMAEAAGNAMHRMQPAPHAVAAATLPPFVTEGIGSLRFDPESYLVTLERRFHGEGAQAEAETVAESLAESLKANGVAPLYVGEPEFSDVEDEEVTASLEVVVPGNELPAAVAESALAHGFREDRSVERPRLQLAQFQELVGKLALDIAVGNMHLIRSEFDIDKGFALLSAELSTVASGGEDADTVIKARLLWQLS